MIPEAKKPIILDMTAERKEYSPQPFVPTLSQREITQSVLEVLSEIRGQRAVIVIAGLSGVGKTAMLDNMSSEIAEGGARVAELYDLLHATGQIAQELQEHTGPFVTTATPFENRHIGDGLSGKGFSSVTTYQLKGMNSQEIADYVAGIMDRNRSSLTEEQIAQYSLGIPLLAQQLTHPLVTEDTAALMSADYLRAATELPYARAILNAATPFLSVPIPDRITSVLNEIADEDTEKQIYSTLYSALAVREELAEQGISEESPFFVAPESQAIYDRMMALGGGRVEYDTIEIVAPNLKPEDLERIQQAFGSFYGKYEETQSTRRKMFIRGDYRKAGIWTGNRNSTIASLVGESANANEIAEKYIKTMESDKLPLVLTDGAIFVLHKHAHMDQSNQVAQIGWMAESLLQQRGIPYFVNNHVIEEGYIFNPETGHIETTSLISR